MSVVCFCDGEVKEVHTWTAISRREPGEPQECGFLPKKKSLNQLTLLTGGKNSHIRMKIQDRLIHARFIEILQFFAKNTIRSNTFLTDLVNG